MFRLTDHRCPVLVGLLLVLVAAAFAYWPGLAGAFLFDDFVNLNALARYGGVRDWDTLLYYLTSGIADPTGRPVAMATFLLDARDWPAEPWPFKRTNLLIHLSNGVLLYSVLSALGRRWNVDPTRARLAALIAAALWLFSPLWVSTVLYVVQRHAMLAALFVLAGIRAWIGSRNAFEQGNTGRGWLLALLSVPVFGGLAGLSKANGFLLPLLLLVLELSILRAPRPMSLAGRRAGWLLVWLPTLLLLAWLGWYALQLGLDGTHGRPWTLAQRMLSQPRALCDYLWHLLIPGLNATGVFADGFVPSHGWLTPWTTLPAILVLVAMATAAWGLRKRVPIVAAAIGFFLAGHTMESSVVMLELYFEHRNYLPAALWFWPMAWWLTTPGAYRRWLIAGGIGYGVLMLSATAVQARLWSDPLKLALTWAEQHPHSARAQTYAFHQEVAAGRYELAENRLARLLETNPHEPQYALNLLNLRCERRQVTEHDIERAAVAIQASRGLALDMTNQWLAATLEQGSAAACASLADATISRLAQAAINGTEKIAQLDPEAAAREQRILGYLALRRSDCRSALQAFDKRIAVQPRPEFVQTHVSLLAGRCGEHYALIHLRRYLDSGSPVHKASSPMLQLRDKMMKTMWHRHWNELKEILENDSDETLSQSLSSRRTT